MKRIIGLITVLVLCFALAVPAFATSNTFVPSITAKPAPELVVGDTTVKVDGTEGIEDVEGTEGAEGTVTEFVPVIEVKNALIRI